MNITVRVMTKQAQVMLANLERQLTTTSRVASTSSFGAGQAAVAAKGFKALGNSMQWAGYQLLHAFTIPLLAAGGAAAKYELDNEKAFANVKKVYGDAALAAQDHGAVVTNELAALRKEFTALSDVYGVSQTEVIKVAESWAAAGVSGAALGKAVENTMKTMVIGDLNAADATRALIAIQAQYGASTTEMTDILNALNVVENQTGASMGDLITGFGNAASVAAQAGVDYQHLAAMIAALVPAQGTAAKAGNALKTIFTDLLVPTSRATEALKEMGINVDDTSWRSKTATERLEELSVKFRALDGNQKVAASNYIAGKYQISRFAQSMADLSKSFDANGKLITNNYSALGEYGRALEATKDKQTNAKIAQQELNTVLESNPQKLKQVWTILKNDAASSVTRLIPFLIQFVTIIAGLVHAFSNLNPVIQRWVAILVLGLAILGPILLYIAALSKLMAVMGTVFRTAGRGLLWFFGLFKAGDATIANLEREIASVKKQIAELSKVDPVARLQAELEDLQIQLAALKAPAASLFEEMSVASTAAAEVIAADSVVIRDAYLGTLLDIDTAFASTAETGDAAFTALAINGRGQFEALAIGAGTAAYDTSVAWQTSYELQVAAAKWAAEAALLAAGETETVYVASAEGIELAHRTLAATMADLEASKALAALAAADEAQAAWVAAYDVALVEINDNVAAFLAAEAAKQAAMLETLRIQMFTIQALHWMTTEWTAAGILGARSVDQVTAAYIGLMATLYEAQQASLAMAQLQIENTAAVGTATAAIAVRTEADIIAAAQRAAMASVVAAVEAGQGWVSSFEMQVIAAEVAAAAFAAAEAVKVEAMLAALAVMRTTMTARLLLEGTWTAAGLAEAASVDAVTAALIVQIRTLQSLSAARLSAAAAAAPAAIGAGAGAGAAGAGAGAAGAAGALGGAGGTRLIDDGAANAVRGIDKLGPEMEQAATKASAKTEGVFARMFGRIGTIFKGGIAGLGRILTKIPLLGSVFEGLGTAAAAAGAAVGLSAGAIIGIILAVIAVILVFRHQFTNVTKEVIDSVTNMAQGVWAGLKAVGGFFADAAQWVIDSMIALPSAILQIMQAVVNIIGKAAKEVYELFSYINPFAHHSPSLVENVDKGMDAVARKFAGIRGSISATMKSAYADIKLFGQAIAGLIKTDEQAKQAADIQLLSKYAPGAIVTYKALAGDLAELTDEYNKLGAAQQREQVIVDAQKAAVDDLNDKLKIQTDILDGLKDAQTKASDALAKSQQDLQNFADAPIQGMKAMNDQIFANTMAQKQLQLQMDQMEDAVGPIDKVQQKMSDLQGQIEKLKGEQADLRAGGAGSDILSAYDNQIKALQGQQSGIQSTVDAYQQMQDALDALNRQGDELTLQQSLQFDPLTKQIQDLVDTTKELPFDTIVAGITATQAEIVKNTKAYDDATTAVDAQQKAVDALTVSRDAQQKLLDQEQKKLDGITNAYNKVGDAIQAVNQAMSDMTTAANDLATAQKKASDAAGGGSLLGAKSGLKSAAGTATIGREGGLNDQSAKIEADTKAQLDKLKGLYDKMDLFGGLKKKFREAGDWIKKWIWDEPAKWGDWLSAKFKDWSKALGGWPATLAMLVFPPALIIALVTGHINTFLAPFKKLGGWIVDAITSGWDAVSSFFSGIGSWIVGVLSDAPGWLLNVGKNILSGLVSGLSTGLSAIATFFSNLPGYILDLIVALPGLLVTAGKDLIYGFAYALGFAVGMVWRFFTQLLPKILGFFIKVDVWLFQTGWDLLKGLANGIGEGGKAVAQFFMNLPGWILSFLVGAGEWIGSAGKAIAHGLLTGITEGAKAIGDFFTNLPGWIASFLSNAVDWLGTAGKAVAQGLEDGIVEGGKAIGTFFSDLPGNIIDFFVGAPGWLYNIGSDILHGLWNGIKAVFGGIWSGIKTFIGGFIDGFKKALGIHSPSTIFLQIGKDIMQGLWNGIKFLWNTVISFFAGLGVAIFNAVGNLAGTLYQVGKDLLSGAWEGIKFVWTTVSNFFSGMGQAALMKLGKLEMKLYYKGKDLLNGAWNGIKFIWITVSSFFANLGTSIMNKIGKVGNTLHQKGVDILNGMKSGVSSAWTSLGSWFSGLPGRIGGYFLKASTWLVDAGSKIASGLATGIRNGLSGLSKVFGTPVYWAVKYAINPIISGIDKLGVNIPTIDTSKIPHFAKGGVVPGKHNRDDVAAYLTPGEVVVPKPVVNKHGGPDALMDELGFNGKKKRGHGHHFGFGGWITDIPGDIGDAVTGAAGAIAGVAKDAWGNLEKAGSAIASAGAHSVGALGGAIGNGFDEFKKDVVDPATHLLRKGAAKAFMAAVGNPVKKADNFLDKYGKYGVAIDHNIDDGVDAIYNWIKGGEASSQKDAEKIIGKAGNIKNHAAFEAQALVTAGHKPTADLMSALGIIISYESGWNPNAINLTDSNAKAGHPSQGLMQTIPSTFEAYRLKTLPDVITNPLSNAVAGIRYADSRYGGLNAVPGVEAVRHGGTYVGYDKGGLLPTGTTNVFNGTGRAEVVAPSKTFDDMFGNLTLNLNKAGAAFSKLASQDNNSATEPTVINNHTEYHFHGDLSFPNIKSGDGAHTFISNLESLVK